MNEYFTDGSASPNPGPGGYAVILKGEPVALGSEDGKTTNIRMEAHALIAALEHAKGRDCIIYTDSEFWINVITKWAPGWESKGWQKKGGPIKNLELVKEVYNLYHQSKARLIWTKGHADDEGNILADEWANKAREGARL